jgi:hypothetical protein
MYGNSASVPKPVEAKKPVSLRPLGQPPSTSVDRLECTTKSTRLFVHSNGLETDLIFPALFHRFRLLPNDLGRSLGDGQNGSRCPYGFLVYDVLTETRYSLTNQFKSAICYKNGRLAALESDEDMEKFWISLYQLQYGEANE